MGTTTPAGHVVIVVTAGMIAEMTVVTIDVMTASPIKVVVVVVDLQDPCRRTTPWVDVTCQIYNKEGHYAKDCWSRYSEDDDYGDKEIHATYGVDTNWYQDSGATHHITSELNNLTVRDSYKGSDRVNTANGQGMSISHIGHSIVRNPTRNFHLRNVLHVPHASKISFLSIASHMIMVSLSSFTRSSFDQGPGHPENHS
jgi:hypothetical protein